MAIRTERWLIIPLTCPRPIRHCPTCGVLKDFVCSERFRVNAQKKVIDVWLHYRCNGCSGAWKYPVLERQPVAALDATTYEAYVRHDKLTVWKHAFDVGRLRKYVAQIDTNVEVVVERNVVDAHAADDGLCIDLEAPFACDIRLDRLLASELRVARTRIKSWYISGELQVLSEQGNALNRRVRTGQRLVLSAAAMVRLISSNTCSAIL